MTGSDPIGLPLECSVLWKLEKTKLSCDTPYWTTMLRSLVRHFAHDPWTWISEGLREVVGDIHASLTELTLCILHLRRCGANHAPARRVLLQIQPVNKRGRRRLCNTWQHIELRALCSLHPPSAPVWCQPC